MCDHLPKHDEVSIFLVRHWPLDAMLGRRMPDFEYVNSVASLIYVRLLIFKCDLNLPCGICYRNSGEVAPLDQSLETLFSEDTRKQSVFTTPEYLKWSSVTRGPLVRSG